MAWTVPKFPHNQVDNAGKMLVSTNPDFFRFNDALEIINNWRSSHGRPLQGMKMTLLGRARSIFPEALVAERRKRIPAIELKLRSNPNMKLSKMHDIGGCRAVVKTVADVEKLLLVYEKATEKNARRGGEFVKKFDYITTPKATGYRGIHLVYKYKSDSRDLMVFNGLRIEIQLRSQIQHAWATAVETVDIFTAQALKSNIGKDSWKRFFALAASAFAAREGRAFIPGTPNTVDGIKKELRKFGHEITVLEGFQKATELIEKREGHIFLLELDSEKRTVRTTGFQQTDMLKAQESYLSVEKLIKDKPEQQVVLVSVDSFTALSKAYPNYFLDVTDFVSLVKESIRVY